MASGSATAEAPHTASIMVAKVFTATKYNVNIGCQHPCKHSYRGADPARHRAWTMDQHPHCSGQGQLPLCGKRSGAPNETCTEGGKGGSNAFMWKASMSLRCMTATC